MKIVNPKKIIESMVGGSQQKLAQVLESIHGRLELMNEQLGKILYILEHKFDIEGRYNEDVGEDKGDIEDDIRDNNINS